MHQSVSDDHYLNLIAIKLKILQNTFGLKYTVIVFLILAQQSFAQVTNNYLKKLCMKSDIIVLGKILDITCYDSTSTIEYNQHYFTLIYTIEIDTVFKDNVFNNMRDFMINKEDIFIYRRISRDTMETDDCNYYLLSDKKDDFKKGDNYLFFLFDDMGGEPIRCYYKYRMAYFQTDKSLFGLRPNLPLARKIIKYARH
jgi:hypothetical protein